MKYVITAVRHDGSEYRVGEEIEIDMCAWHLRMAGARFDAAIDRLAEERA